MQNWQKDLWATLAGVDPKKIKIYMGGRQIGKSALAQIWNQTFEFGEFYSKIDQATVDRAQWYTIKCSVEISSWIKNQPSVLWHEHIDKDWKVYKNTFDIHEKIYTMIQLKYGDARI